MIIRKTPTKMTEFELKGDDAVFTHREDISEILRENQISRKSPTNGFTPDRSWRRVASIPSIVMLEWQKKYPELKHGVDYELRQKRLKWLLRQRENEVFKTCYGGV